MIGKWPQQQCECDLQGKKYGRQQSMGRSPAVHQIFLAAIMTEVSTEPSTALFALQLSVQCGLSLLAAQNSDSLTGGETYLSPLPSRHPLPT